MKKVFCILIALILFVGCKKDEEVAVATYACIDGNCMEAAGGPYLTLQGCAAECNCDCGQIDEDETEYYNALGWPVDSDDENIAFYVYTVENMCSGDEGSACVEEALGMAYCMDYQSVLGIETDEETNENFAYCIETDDSFD